ncbi:FAD-binding and (Fe-S)-binding domain-containing protein [Arthrobacter sp.]|uniref:FAD-binding and (Fe-S)-binding domain-containing protein n=1 Tax=Arthrobacter sp. TaxID=1667 RepID=UPI00258C01AD|nr:FAD-binding and (Fe-S)-binding domain-containing protein [Arthrobacter sp.]
MTRIELPTPTVRTAGLEADLRARVDGEVRFDAGSRAAYSTDSSNYRQVPVAVVVPRTVEAAAEAMLVCGGHGVPVLSRGGGTSLAGQCTNAAVVIDCSKYLTQLLSVDPRERSCWVEPGIVLDELNGQLAAYGLEFGPRPATHDHCTVGGMLGNNSCGATAQRTGKTVDNTLALEVMLPDGTRMEVGATSKADYLAIVQGGGRQAQVYGQLRELVDAHGEEVRRQYPRIPRRVSGYNLDSLLPEHGFNVAQALVGSEGTCVFVLRAKLRLMPVVAAKAVVLLGYPDAGTSGDDVPAILDHDPIALEGFDGKVVGYERATGLPADALALLPDGPQAWLLVEFGADTPQQAADKAHAFAAAARASASRPTVTEYDGGQARRLWKLREAALGATAHVPGLPAMWPGWEDSAVAPERMGDYLRALRELYAEFGFEAASLYGHYGQGCVHTRIPFDLATAAGVATFRTFMERAARLVVSMGGSLSGEHGDGQARAELLPVMYGPGLIAAFARFRAIFDPQGIMNPGKLGSPARLDADLRLGAGYAPAPLETHFAFPDDGGSFSEAVLRCVGVGACRRHEGGVMCPSYMVTREEAHSTRGRARLLFEMLQGHEDSPIGDGWRSEAVRDALDLCLSCKGCKQDCPVSVDMATYKAEFLSHFYAGRVRPRSHYSMGWLPLWARLAALAPRLLNAVSQAPLLSRAGKELAGVAPERRLPQFAPQTFQAWYAGRGPRGSGTRGDVVLWPDTFSNAFHPHVAQAAVAVLEDAGWNVVVPPDPVCCGLTWISTGQLDVAKKVLRRTVDVLAPHLRAGTLILGLEPSCTAVFRSDAAELFPSDPDVRRLREQTVTLAELLVNHSPGWQPPPLARRALVQTHCHQHAVMGFGADVALMQRMGVDAEVLDSGCCGLAGNFGFEKGHYDVSEACGERVLFPALRSAEAGAVILADGFSCRTQIEQGDAGGRQGVHLAELLAAALHQDAVGPGERPEDVYAERPHTPRTATIAALAACLLLGAACVAGPALGLRSMMAARRRMA